MGVVNNYSKLVLQHCHSILSIHCCHMEYLCCDSHRWVVREVYVGYRGVIVTLSRAYMIGNGITDSN